MGHSKIKLSAAIDITLNGADSAGLVFTMNFPNDILIINIVYGSLTMNGDNC